MLRVAWVAKLLARNGVIVLCSFVSPYRDVRAEVRSIVEEEGGFSSVEELVEFVLNEALSEEGAGEVMSKEDEEKVKERLRSLGYI